MAPRATLIANPVAGSDEAQERITDLRDRLSGAYLVDVVLTSGAGDARQAAIDAARLGREYLFVAGGDGTLNEAVNGLANAEALAQVVIGIIPLGTGNDFASALRIPTDLDGALDTLLSARPIPVDVGEVNGRYFVNASAGGFLAEVSDAVDPTLKSLAGRLAYLLGGAKVLMQAEPFRCRVGRIDRDCLLFAVCNAPTIGGGRLIAPDAVVDDGLLDVCVVEAMDPLSFVALLRKVSDGTHTDVTGVEYFRAPALSLQFDREVAVNVDGEVFRARSCDYRVLPAAARFLAPAVSPA